MDFVGTDFSIVYIPLDTVELISLRRISCYSIPGLYTLLDSSSMEASGILSTHSSPVLGNRGRGVLIGIIDTGIDYTNPPFRNPDGTTRINSIWGQSLSEDKTLTPPSVPGRYNASEATYGTEYTREQINQALEPDDPLALAPSTDVNGHGTFLTGIAAGGFLPEEDLIGAALGCKLLTVKLKPAKQYLRDFYLVSNDADVYQGNDTMMGIKYLHVEAFSRGKPSVILLGIGSNLGNREGTPPLSVMLQDISRYLGTATVIIAGSETGRGHHYMGTISTGESSVDVEIRMGQPESQWEFAVELWASTIDTYSAGFPPPSRETINCTSVIAGNETSIPFLSGPTVITVNYQLTEVRPGRQLIFMRFETSTTGIWKTCVYNTQSLTGQFNMWLPTYNLIPEGVVFPIPSPYTIVTLPGNVLSLITVGAHNHLNNSVYIHSSRGYMVGGLIKPDLAALGVDVNGPAIGRRIRTSVPTTTRTGTLVAAVHAAGAAANLLGWGIVEGNNTTMSEASIKAYLIRGVRRNPALSHPNREWGYGAPDLYETFLRLRE